MAVRDNTAKHRYELETDGVTAFVTYRRKGNVVTILHTDVPQQLAGRGVGSALARGVLDDLREQGAKLIVKCPFISAYIAKHPDYQDLLDESATLDARLDEALDETFPASDSTAVTPRR